MCLEQNPRDDGTERVEVKIKSNRAFAMWIVVPRFEADYVWVEGSDWDRIGPVLNAFSRGPVDQVLLAPGRTLTVGYQRPRVTSSELTFFAYQDFVTQVATYLTRHLGDVNGYVATLLAAMSCFNVDEPLESWDRAYNCFNAGLGLTENQVELAFDQAVASGRLSLGQGQIDAFRSEYLSANRLKTTLSSIKKLSLGVALARLGADSWVAAVDAGAGYVDLASTTIGNLIPEPAEATTTDEPEAELTSCEGTDTSLIEGDLAAPVVGSFPWGIAEATTTLGAGPAVLVTLINTIERQRIATWWNVEDGPALSGYTVESIIETGVPAQVAQLLFDTLDACAGCAYRDAGIPTPTDGTNLRRTGIGGTNFGSDADDAIATLIGQLGTPDDDSGWYKTGYDPTSEDDQCQTPTMRVLIWRTSTSCSPTTTRQRAPSVGDGRSSSTPTSTTKAGRPSRPSKPTA